MLPHTIYPLLLFLALPGWMISLLLPAILPFVSSTVATWLHAEITKGESWYAANVHGALQGAIAVAVGLGITLAGSAITGIPGGQAVVTDCVGGAASGLSALCLTDISNLASSGNITLLLTAILTGAGVLAVKQERIHAAAKALAQKAGIVLPPSAR